MMINTRGTCLICYGLDGVLGTGGRGDSPMGDTVTWTGHAMGARCGEAQRFLEYQNINCAAQDLSEHLG